MKSLRKKNKFLSLLIIISLLIGNIAMTGFTLANDDNIDNETIITDNDKGIMTEVIEVNEDENMADENMVEENTEIENFKQNIIKEIKDKYNEIANEKFEHEENIAMKINEFVDRIEKANSIEEVKELYEIELQTIEEIGSFEIEVEENPDNLPGPMEIEAPFIDNDFIDENLKNMSRMSRSSEELKPGEVKMTKTATPVEAMVNTWDIELKVECRDSESDSDIVLVIDTSGSMGDKGRMKAAKKAAIEFANKLLDDENVRTRIAVVSFGSGARIRTGLTKDKKTVIDAINDLYANGGTFTQSGVYQARQLLAKSVAAYKNIVLLSDGEPTYSYALYKFNDYLVPFSDGRETGTNIPESAFNRSVAAGNGMNLRTRFGKGDNYYNHGNSAIAEAGYAKSDGYSFYTISLQAGSDGTRILKEMSSLGKDYTGDPEDLARIFNEIGGDILSAAKEAKVSDPMGQGFTVCGKASDIKVSKGKFSYDADKKHIDWTIGTLSDPITTGSDIKYATMTYRIEIDDDILNASSSDGKNYSTNGETVLEYTDYNNKRQRILAEVPSVDPIILALEKKLINSLGFEIKAEDMGTDERFFNIHVTSEEGYNHTYPLKAGQKRVMTNLRLEDNYEVVEDKFSGNTTHSANDYKTSYNIYGEDTDKFTIRQGDPDTPVIVTNRELPLGELKVSKLFNPGGIEVRRSMKVPEFKFELRGPNKADGTSSLKGIDGLTLENGKYTFTLGVNDSKTFKNLPYAEYQVVEIETNGFVPSYSTPDGKITLTIDQKVGEVMVTNTPGDDDKTIDIEAKKIWVGGKTEEHIAVDLVLLKDGVETDIKPTSVEKDKNNNNIFNYTWKGLQKYREDGSLVQYSVKEPTVPDNYKASIEGFVVTNKYTPEKFNFTATKKWVVDEEVTIPKMNFELYRKIEDGEEEKVPNAEIKVVDGVKKTATWNVDKTNQKGEKYIYFVKESFVEDKASNANWILGEYDFKDNSITNTLVTKGNGKDGEIKVEKKLENEIQRIMRTTNSQLVFKVVLTNEYGKKIEVLIKAGETKILKDLYYGDYTIKETEAHGYTPSYNPEKLTLAKGDTTQKFVVTNTNTGGGNVIEITVTKVWDGGLATNPSATIELWRKGIAKDNETPIDEKIREFTATKDKTSEIFKELAKNDPSGRAFEYYVKEPTVPDNYKASIEGYTVTNKYTPEKFNFTATKKWVVDEEVTIPKMNFELYRKIEDGVEEKVSNAEIKVVDGNTTTATWNVDKTNQKGEKYIYFVKESFVEDKASNANWILGEYNFNDNSITNTLVTKGNGKDGKIEVEKILENEIQRIMGTTNSQLVFKVVLTNEYGKEIEVLIKAGETKILKDLYYGDYTIKETETHGYTPSYNPEELTLIKGDTTPRFVVTNKNTGGDGTSVEITVTKVWVGGEEINPEATIALWRKGLEKDSTTVIDEEVDSFNATKDKTSEIFKELAKNDPSGREFEYYVKELTVPEGYEVSISGNMKEGFVVTNTYTMREDLKGVKTWDHKNNSIGNQPKEITIILKGNGEEKGRQIVSSKNNWSYKFENYPIKDEKGNKIIYAIDEVNISNYTKKITGFNIKNTYEEPYIPPVYPTDPEPQEPGKPIDPDIPAVELNKEDHYMYMIGYSDGNFKPNGNITRAESVTIFFRMLTETSRNNY